MSIEWKPWDAPKLKEDFLAFFPSGEWSVIVYDPDQLFWVFPLDGWIKVQDTPTHYAIVEKPS